MNTTAFRKQTSFRLNAEFIDNLRKEAKRQNRSLNNFAESILKTFMAKKPNDITLAVMKEAEIGDNLETLELNNFRSFIDSL